MKPFRATLLVATLAAVLLALSATPAAADPGNDGGRPLPTRPAAFPGDPGVPSFERFPGDPGVRAFERFPGDPGVPSFERFPGDPGELAFQ